MNTIQRNPNADLTHTVKIKNNRIFLIFIEIFWIF